jgi:acyl-CoA synthetase (AMP-forming)/AMP-acid ligase II
MDDQILRNMTLARSLPHLAPGERLTEFASLADMLDQRSVQSPKAECLVFYDEDGARHAWTYADFTADVRRVAEWLLERGLERGDRIATMSPNHSDTVLQYFAAWLIGAVVVPINGGEDDDRVGYILADSEAKLAFVRDLYIERVGALRDRLPALETVVVCGDECSNERGDSIDSPLFAEILATEEPATDFAPSLDDEALIVYTSGTTGHPKGVVLTQYNLLVDGQQIADWHGVGPGDRMMCVLPIHHVNGTVVTLVAPLVAGGTTVLNHRFHTSEFFGRLAAERIAIVSVVPTLLAFLLQAADSEGGGDAVPDLPDFKHIICGAGPLTVELALKFQDRFGLRIVHGYGLSETTCYSCFLPVSLNDDVHRRWLGDHGFPSIGCAVPANEMAIHGPDGQPVAEGERGEIVIRGHNVMAGYFRNDQANADAFAGGWFHSGDEGFWRADESGASRDRRYFFITGRLKELIIRGGVNVSPLEIDEVLMNLPGVKAGVSVGFENNVYGEEIGAYVVLDEGEVEDAEYILAACRAVLPHHKCPKVVVYGTEVPVTSTGKYQRSKLKPLFVEWRGVQFRQ